MGTWSITPDTGLASIDQNGLLTYQQHTSDVTYTISYSDDEGCSTSKNVTIKKCVPTCDCSRLTVLGKLNISKDGGDNITIGTLSKASCMSNPRASSSESWLSNITVSGNDIKATVALNSGDSRIGSVTVTVDKDGGGTCDRTMSIMQQAGGECTGRTYNIIFGLYFENQPVVLDDLEETSVYSVQGPTVKYTKCDGSKGSFNIGAAFNPYAQNFVSFRKDDFINASEALKSTTYTIADLASIDSIDLGIFIAAGRVVNNFGGEIVRWGGDYDYRGGSVVPETSYRFDCHSEVCHPNSYLTVRSDYQYDSNEIRIYISIEDINWIPTT